MVARIADAVAAYANAAGRLRAPGMEPRSDSATASFGAMVRDALNGAIDAGRHSEQVSAQALVGRADLTDVVTAVNNAEMTLQAVVSIRDRVIEAYQEIIRMPV